MLCCASLLSHVHLSATYPARLLCPWNSPGISSMITSRLSSDQLTGDWLEPFHTWQYSGVGKILQWELGDWIPVLSMTRTSRVTIEKLFISGTVQFLLVRLKLLNLKHWEVQCSSNNLRFLTKAVNIKGKEEVKLSITSNNCLEWSLFHRKFWHFWEARKF